MELTSWVYLHIHHDHDTAGSDEWYQAELQRIRKVDSTYTILEHDESVHKQLEVLEKLTPADSGSLMSWDGKKVS